MAFFAKPGWILGALAFASRTAQAASQRPTDPTLEPAHDLPPYRAALEGGVKDLSAAMLKARGLIDEGRRLADIRPFAYAERLLKPYPAQISRSTDWSLLRAQIPLVQGRGQDALRDCMSLVGREAALIWSACSAQAFAIGGRLSEAQRLLEASLRGAPLSGARGSRVFDEHASVCNASKERARE